MAFNVKLGMMVDLYMVYNICSFDDLDIDAMSQWLGRGKILH